MMRVRAIISHVVACVIVAAVVSNLSSNPLQLQFTSSIPETRSSSASVKTEIETSANDTTKGIFIGPDSSNTIQQRVDLYNCLKTNRTTIAPTSLKTIKTGWGHKVYEIFYTLWFAVTKGYCICLSSDYFQNEAEIYHLLLESFIPPCHHDNFHNPLELKQLPPNATHHQIHRVWSNGKDVWPLSHLETPRQGHGDLLVFMDHFLRDNHLLSTAVHPWYQRHKTISSAFSNSSRIQGIVTVALHVRVGDVILDATRSYWHNLLVALHDIVRFEFGPDRDMHLYWIYFRAEHRGPQGNKERLRLAKNKIGEWTCARRDLPKSHRFIASLCAQFDNMQCFWKSGTNIVESIDLIVESKVVYVSGSSFSQVLSLFQFEGIKLVAVPKEIVFNIETHPTFFLQTHTSLYTSLRNYYIDMDGKLYPEQFAYLRMKQPRYSTVKI
jgi:hypothetical protein